MAFGIPPEGPNTPPAAENDSFVTDEDTVHGGFLVAVDAEGDLLSYSLADQAVPGTGLLYTPAAAAD